MKIGHVRTKASRWPWQPIGGRWDQAKSNSRYGWNWNLGIMASNTTIILSLLFGQIRIGWSKQS